MSGSPTHPEVELTEDSSFQIQGKVLLILCGLIASGKSTFAEALQDHYPQFCRCNQDDLGNRRRVEQLAYETLNQGLSACIDRTNFNASQRSYWIEIAREFPGTAIWAIVFDTPYEVCAERLKTRTGHPTILNADQGLSVLSHFAADFQYPTAREGFDRILYVKPSDHPASVYTRSDITAILQRVQDSQPIVQQQQSSRQGAYNHSRGRSGYPPYRGNAPGGRGRRGGWGEASYHYANQGVPIGRGGNLNVGPSNHLRGWRSPPYGGGTGVGIYTSGRGSPRPAGTHPNPREQSGGVSRGKRAAEDPLHID
ncbi:P-loop containing nucleoside triphosphate hydrolase protein [Pholiota conissans]|uniref:P-loop containing nucleoside triphosphate hydrolase protein n=1 Tax=Pholiota conissans TaxID=109636 RepID=A0A9P5YXU4_9AGAR|nr:P-loop containing nucleoside triphosphate hydrolase protein [Pholiota conissans]